jgi:hypothetical protein
VILFGQIRTLKLRNSAPNLPEHEKKRNAVTVKSSKKEAKLLKRLFWAQGDVKATRVAGVGVQGREMLSYAT